MIDAHHNDQSVRQDYIESIIDKLHRGRSPGIDDISPEHLIHGKSDKLLLILSSLYSVILSRACVLSRFHKGVVVQILKKNDTGSE